MHVYRPNVFMYICMYVSLLSMYIYTLIHIFILKMK